MNYYDIQKKLGVEPEYNDRIIHFYVRLCNVVLAYPEDRQNYTNNYISADELFKICQDVGLAFSSFRYINESCYGYPVANVLQHIFAYYEDLKDSARCYKENQYNMLFIDFLSVLSVLMQSKYFRQKKHSLLSNTVKESLDVCRLPYRLERGIILPMGATELDDALVGEVFDWLQDYPKTYETYKRVLIGYSKKDYDRDVADNLRKTLEVFLQEFLKNNKNLDNNKSEVGSYLKGKVNGESIALLTTLLHHYKQYNDSNAKHHDNVKEDEVEFLLYQTGVFIRFLIQIRRTDDATQGTRRI